MNLTIDELRAELRAALPELLSIRQAARALGVSAGRTLAPLVASGAVRTVRIGNGRPRIPRAEIERIAREGIEPAPFGKRRAPKRAPPLAHPTQAEANAALKAMGF